MTDPITLADLGLPETLIDPDDGTRWHLSDPAVEVQVRMTHPDSDGDLSDTTPATYPLGAIQSKLEYGDLERPAPDMIECPECDYEAESEHGLKTHLGIAHGEEQPDLTEE